VTSLFSRKPATAATEPTDDKSDVDVVTAPARPRGYTPSKKEQGKATPKRGGGTRAEPPPANKKEAVKRAREKQRAARAESRAGMMAGKDEYLLARDKGPERALVRNVVDSRRNLASYFIGAAVIFLLGSSGGMPPVVRSVANTLSTLMVLALVVDSYLLSRRIGAKIKERFPKDSKSPRSYYYYGILRSLSPRRMRMPSPQVKLGTKV
jgi:hypothetical protein